MFMPVQDDARSARAALEVERLAVIAAQRQADEARAAMDALTTESNKLKQELEVARKEVGVATQLRFFHSDVGSSHMSW
jgi:hypothetical protein